MFPDIGEDNLPRVPTRRSDRGRRRHSAADGARCRDRSPTTERFRDHDWSSRSSIRRVTSSGRYDAETLGEAMSTGTAADLTDMMVAAVDDPNGTGGAADSRVSTSPGRQGRLRPSRVRTRTRGSSLSRRPTTHRSRSPSSSRTEGRSARKQPVALSPPRSPTGDGEGSGDRRVVIEAGALGEGTRSSNASRSAAWEPSTRPPTIG